MKSECCTLLFLPPVSPESTVHLCFRARPPSNSTNNQEGKKINEKIDLSSPKVVNTVELQPGEKKVGGMFNAVVSIDRHSSLFYAVNYSE